MAKTTTDLTQNIAKITWSEFINNLPDPDKVLAKAGKGIEAYRDLGIDDHLYSVRQQRENKLLSMLWELYRKDSPDNVYEVVNKALEGIKIYDLIKNMLDARFMGTAVIEIIWQFKNGYWLPEELQLKPVEWFRLKPDLTWRMFLPGPMGQTFAGEGQELPPYKFLIVQNSANSIELYGEKLLKRCFWPVTLKRGGLKFWAKFTEKYGMPQLYGKLPAGTPKEKINEFLSALEMLFEDAVAVGPSDGSIDAINAATGSNAENYEKYLQFLENSISKAVLTQTLTTQLGDSGSYAAANSHGDTLADLARSDAQFIAEAMDTLIKYIVELNFSTVPEDLPKFVMYYEKETDKVLAERDKTLTDIGVEFLPAYIERVYNIPKEEFKMKTTVLPLSVQTPAQFADTPSGEISPIDKLTRAVIDKARSQINTFASFGDLLDNLDQVFGAIDAEKIRVALAKESFAAQLKGIEDVG